VQTHGYKFVTASLKHLIRQSHATVCKLTCGCGLAFLAEHVASLKNAGYGSLQEAHLRKSAAAGNLAEIMKSLATANVQ